MLNEEAILENYLAPLAGQCAQHNCELLIVDGGSTDNTAAIAQRYGQVIHSARGRATQMNAGAATAKGDVLFFVHADTRLPAEAFSAIAQTLASPGVVGGAFRLCFNCDQWTYHLVAYTTNLRSRFRNIFTGDQAYFIRSDIFHAVGGYPDQPLMEDLEIIARLRKFGKVILLPLYVTTSARRHEKMGLFHSVLFMWFLRTLYRLGVPPAQLQRMYLDIR